MDDSFRLLTGGNRAALPRQQTLRSTIDWSYNLLTKPEQALLRRSSVFAGGWSLEAAEAVCPDGGVRGYPPEARQERKGIRGRTECGVEPDPSVIRNSQSTIRNEEVLGLLASLVEKSLVWYEERAA